MFIEGRIVTNMSGGRFYYDQFKIRDIAEEIEKEIQNNTDYSQETIEEFRKAVRALKIAETYTHRIDWLLSGDDGEESFHERLKEELKDTKFI